MQQTDNNSEPTERLVSLVGEAIVEWSKIESLWSLIFELLLYRGIRQEPPPKLDATQQSERAKAVYFSQSNSAAQRRMVVALAEAALGAEHEMTKGLAKLERRTGDLSGWRNGIVHSYYERPISVDGSVVTWGAVEMAEYGRHSRFRDRDPLAEIPKLIGEFNKHEGELADIFLELFD